MAKAKDKKATGQLRSLSKWHIILAIVFLLQGILILLLSKNVTLPVTTHFLAPDSLAGQVAGHPVYTAANRRLFDVSVVAILAIIFFIAAIVHALLSTAPPSRSITDRPAANRLRWLEYGINGGLILVLLALVNGAYDISTLVLLFALTFLTGLLMLWIQLQSAIAAKTRWIINLFALIGGLLPWAIIACYLFDAAAFGMQALPAYVYWLDGSMFVLFVALALNFYAARHKLDRWVEPAFGERAFMFLGFIIKTALAWQLFFGLLH